MRKIIKQYGNTIIITLTPDELLAYNLKTGDIVNIILKKLEDKE